MHVRAIIAACLLASCAAAVDINVAEDEAKKAEALILAPAEGEGYYDSTALAELALERARRSPSGALRRSFAVPGWGQFYNGKPWKAGVIIAAEAGTLGTAVTNYVTARRYLREARAAKDKATKEEKYGRYNDYVVETEFWGWLFVGVLAYSMMDAYVDAHLADWDVSNLPADKDAPPPSSRLDVEFRGNYVSVAIGLF